MLVRKRALPVVLPTFPPTVRWGFALVLVGGLVDVAYHLAPLRPGLDSAAGLAGHLITLLGMVIVMVGVLAVGLRNRHP
jgi:hypothetical protein